VAMRMCGHAHHDDMLYLGKDPAPSWSYPPLSEPGYADPLAYAFWSARDPITTYARRLVAEGTIAEADLLAWQREAEATVEAEARRVIEAPWPDGSMVGVGVLAGEPPRHRVEVLEKREAARAAELPPLDPGPPMDPRGRTFLDAVTMGVGDALRADPALMPAAAEEMLRWWTPVMTFRRTATSECELGGQHIGRGDKVVVSFTSGNRDEAVFADSDRFDIRRHPNPHLVFGHGPHFCLGAHLARIQTCALFDEILARTSSLTYAGQPSYLRSNFQRGVKRLPVTWTA